MKMLLRNRISLLFAALMLAGLSACSKTEVVEPAAPTVGVRSLTGNGGPEDPTGGISDDGDDEGDNERSQRRVVAN